MEVRRNSHYDGFKSNSERDIKSVFQIDVTNNSGLFSVNATCNLSREHWWDLIKFESILFL